MSSFNPIVSSSISSIWSASTGNSTLSQVSNVTTPFCICDVLSSIVPLSKFVTSKKLSVVSSNVGVLACPATEISHPHQLQSG
jgi:hypothetical protein